MKNRYAVGTIYRSHWGIMMTYLELKIPPIGTFAIAMLGIWASAQYVPQCSFELPLTWGVFGVCFIASGIFGLSALWGFWQVKTTVDPTKPEKANQIVERGIYRVSRNPMYMGLLWLLIGETYWYGNVLGIVVSGGFVYFMNRFQIIPEERILARKFNDNYLAYKTRVRRWL